MNLPLSSAIPIELMDILNRINSNVDEVKQRLARIEGQDHSDSIKALQLIVNEERKERVKLEVDLARVKQQLGPIAAVLALVGAATVQFIFNLVTH